MSDFSFAKAIAFSVATARNVGTYTTHATATSNNSAAPMIIPITVSGIPHNNFLYFTRNFCLRTHTISDFTSGHHFRVQN